MPVLGRFDPEDSEKGEPEVSLTLVRGLFRLVAGEEVCGRSCCELIGENLKSEFIGVLS
jgi:hypothetical protein